MGQYESLLLGDYGCCHGRSKVVYHDNSIGLVVLQIIFKLGHHLSGDFVEVFTYYSQIAVGRGNLQISKEGRLEGHVVFTACVDQLDVDIGTVLAGIAASVQYGRHLDEVRPGACYYANVHFLIILL